MLNNPDNVIVSDELSDLLQDKKPTIEENTFLKINDKILVCQVKKVLLSGNNTTFSLDVPAFSLMSLLTINGPISFVFEGLEYIQFMPADVLWEDNILTLVTRRIFNETI